MSCACTYSSVPRATSQGRAPTPASLSRITVLSSKHHLHGAANSLCNISGKAHRSRGQRLRCQAAGFGGFGGGGGKPDKKSKNKCPCGGGDEKLSYEDCCKKYHKGKEYPDDPVTLMRSRFSAYAQGEVDYIVSTTHPDNPAIEGSKLDSGKVVSTFKQDVKATCKKVRFLKLDVQSSEDGADEREAFVTFQAIIQVTGQKGFRQNNFDKETMLEKSRFLKSEGSDKWLYVDGDVSYV